MTIPECVKRSPVGVVLWQDIEIGESHDKRSLAKTCKCSLEIAGKLIKRLINANLVTVCDWTRVNGKGPHAPVVCRKSGPDKPKPAVLTNAQRCEIYKKRHRKEVLQMYRSYNLRKKSAKIKPSIDDLTAILYR